jgi:hypothetical protein
MDRLENVGGEGEGVLTNSSVLQEMYKAKAERKEFEGVD